ncbi:anthranilate phosphoribosyltransferase [Pradoshia sp.]
MHEYLLALSKGEKVRGGNLTEAIKLLMTPDCSEVEIAAFLMGMNHPGHKADEDDLHVISETIRQASSHHLSDIQGAMDNCGTGGDHSNSFNISTAAAFILASAGIKMTKNGNRNMSSKSGSMDVLHALGINTINDEAEARRILAETNLVFLNAGHIHPRLKSIGNVRRQLKIPTVFNVIGPLTNPVPLDYQMVGIYDESLLEVYGRALMKAGRKRAAVIHGAGGMDEASLAGENAIVLVDRGEMSRIAIHPSEVGLKVTANEFIKGGSPEENAAILIRLLKGEKNAYRDIVVLNAAIGLYVGEKAESFAEGVQLAGRLIDSGKAFLKYEAMTRNHVRVEGNECQII